MRIILTALLAMVAGCAAELETGYKPKPLGVGDEQRRGYYAPAFSPEAQASDPTDTSYKPTIRRPVGY